MNEILFRGKTVETKEWVFGFYNHCHWKGNKHTIRVQKDSHLEDHFIDPKTVGQYAGLEDKNGTKMFKGDINLDWDFKKSEIVWYCGGFYFKYSELEYKAIGSIASYNYCICGNIHDNPELLEAN